MMGFLKNVFTVPKAVDAIINTGNALVFTDEERKEWALRAWKVTGPQTIARRYLTFIIAGIWAFATLNGFILVNLVIFTELSVTDIE